MCLHSGDYLWLQGCCLLASYPGSRPAPREPGYKAAASKRLYLTPAGIHYTEIGSLGCCYRDKFIPLVDIEDVVLQHNTYVNQSGTQIGQDDVDLKFKMKDIRKYLPWYTCKCCSDGYLHFRYVENFIEFSSAIKQEL